MTGLVQAAQLILSLSILVLLHEMGHFLFAKLFNTRVEKFYIFFNPWFALFKKKIGDTEYGIGWLPLGGYVKISGMIDESMDKEQMKQTWQRLLIMIGGVVVNFLLAMVLYATSLYIWGDTYLPTKNVKYGIVCDSLALDMGLQNGDKILSLDNQETENFFSIVPDIILNKVKSVQVEREGRLVNVPVPEEIIAPLLKSEEFIAPRLPYYVGKYSKDSRAKDSGLETDDKIIGLNDKKMEFFDEFKSYLIELKANHIQETGSQNYSSISVNVTILRGEEEYTYPIPLTEDGKIGVFTAGTLADYFELKRTEYSFFESIPAGINKGFRMMVSYLKQLKLIFTPKTKAYESLGGFIKIGSIFPGVWDWQAFWNLTALISIILAIMNILPIPALDGGHVMFLIFEMVTGRKPGDKFLEYAQITGMLILLALLLYANGNDIVQIFQR